jgi:type I restriction enzyme S subunit
VTLGELGVLHCGQSPPASAVNRDGTGVPYVSGPDHWDGNVLSLDKWTTDPRRQVPPACVFITVKGAGVGTIFPGVACAIGRDIYAFEPGPRASARFVEHGLRLRIAEVLKHAVGDIPGLSKRHILDHVISLPPRHEQDAIVAEIEKHFTRLDAAVAALTNAETKVRRLSRSILVAAVSSASPGATELPGADAGRLLEEVERIRRERWHEHSRGKYKPAVGAEPPAFALPAHWCWASLDQLTFRIGDVDHRMPKAVEHGVPYISTKDFSGDDGIDFEGAKRIAEDEFLSLCRKIRPASGDLLISRYGTVGEVRLLQTDIPVQVSYSVAIAKPVPIVSPGYLKLALRSSVVQQQIRQGIRASSQPDVGLEHLRRLALPLPPREEQDAIVAAAEAMLTLTARLKDDIRASLDKATALRRSILTAAFDGALRIPSGGATLALQDA